MADQEYTPEQMTRAIGEVLQTFAHRVDTSVDQAARATGEAGAHLLQQYSPRGYTGRYAKSWTSTPTKRGTVYIHNKKHYRLTHLLEKGHKTMFKSGRYGKKKDTRAIPHISIVEQKVAQDFELWIKNRIEYQQ